MKKFKLEIVVFISGVVVMIYEIIGSRVLAPFVGTSIFVWTSLIGIILASLSLGYYLGGKLADKKSSLSILACILISATLFITITNFSKSLLLIIITQLFHNIKLTTLLSTFILFAPASVLLGMVSPYAVRLKIKNIEHSGSTVGNLYAISTVGSIVGTFSAGFLLIPELGTTKILYLLALLLALTVLFLATPKIKKASLSLMLLLLVSVVITEITDAQTLAHGYLDTDTPYSRVIIYHETDSPTQQTIREMNISGTASSAMFLESDDLVYAYTKYYDLATHFRPDFAKVLMLGGAGYSVPKHFLQSYPDITLDVVEIDPGVTELAKKYFRLTTDPRLRIFHQDGRIFLNKTTEKYDVILGDAFASYYSIPYQLTTKETVQKIYDTLTENGVAIVNIISAIQGDKGKFLRSEYLTYKSIFPQVYIFPVVDSMLDYKMQNIILIASKNKEPIPLKSDQPNLDNLLSHYYNKEIPADLNILTDEYSPVDYYVYYLL